MKIQIKLNLFKKRLRHDSQYSDTINENSDTNYFSVHINAWLHGKTLLNTQRE